MKKIICLICAVVLAASAFAQSSLFRHRLEIASVNTEENGVNLQVFKMGDTGRYYLSVGTLGIGDDYIQVQIDPISELFIPLGDNLGEAYEALQGIQACYTMDDGESSQIDGCLSIAYPNDQLEPVRLTYMKLPLSNILEFSISRGEWIRATHVPRMEFRSLVNGVKFYKKLHQKE